RHTSFSRAWSSAVRSSDLLLIRFGDSIDVEVGRLCLAAAQALRLAQLPGVTDVVPSFVTVAVHYRPGGGQRPRYEELAARIEPLGRKSVVEGVRAGPAQRR